MQHGQLYSKHKTLEQDNGKLQRQLQKSLADNAKLKTATGREDLLRDVQAKLRTVEEELNTNKAHLAAMVMRTKDHEQFRRVCEPILRDTMKRQMHSYQLKMCTLEFRDGYVLGGRLKEPMHLPAALERATQEVRVNGIRDLFLQTTRKRKTCSMRFDHSEVFTNAATREQIKTMMNVTTRAKDAESLAGKVCAISSRGRIAAVKIQNAKYIRFQDIQLHQFERQGLTVSDDAQTDTRVM